MDLSNYAGPLKRLLTGLTVALILLLSLHTLGFSWESSFILALLLAVLGSLNLFTRHIYMLSGLTMVVACIMAFVSGEDDNAKAAGIAPADQPLVKARVALESAAPAVEGVVAKLAPQVEAATKAATTAATQVMERVSPAASATAAPK